MTTRPLLFQIGPNKCGTTSLFYLFQKSGVPSLKFKGTKADDGYHGSNPQKILARNIQQGIDPLTGFDRYQAFFDMEYATYDLSIENYKQYPTYYAAFPHAKFLLNTRDPLNWLRSRAMHAKGSYLQRATIRLGKPGYEVLNIWREEFEQHMRDVRAFFADKPGSLLEYDVENDPIEKVVEFVAPEMELDLKHWAQRNSTLPEGPVRQAFSFEQLFARPKTPEGAPPARVEPDPERAKRRAERQARRARRAEREAAKAERQAKKAAKAEAGTDTAATDDTVVPLFRAGTDG